jgi:hypothetical protein
MDDKTRLNRTGSLENPGLDESTGMYTWSYRLDADGAKLLDLSVSQVGGRHYVLFDRVYQCPVWVEHTPEQADDLAKEIVAKTRDEYNKFGRGSNPSATARLIETKKHRSAPA